MQSKCTAYLLCDRCTDNTVLIESPIPDNLTPIVPTPVTADATVLTVNSVNKVTGAVNSVQLPAAAAEGDALTVHNASFHTITVQSNGGAATLATLEAGGIITYRYENAAWSVY
jgi:hypothetical protein